MKRSVDQDQANDALGIVAAYIEGFEKALGGVKIDHEVSTAFGAKSFVDSLACVDPSVLADLLARGTMVAIRAQALARDRERLREKAVAQVEELLALGDQADEAHQKIVGGTRSLALYEGKKAGRASVGGAGGKAKAAKSEVSKALREVDEEYRRILRREAPFMKPSDFARAMIEKYSPILHKSFGRIKNRCTELEAEQRAASRNN